MGQLDVEVYLRQNPRRGQRAQFALYFKHFP